jgi:hypothetical protein
MIQLELKPQVLTPSQACSTKPHCLCYALMGRVGEQKDTWLWSSGVMSTPDARSSLDPLVCSDLFPSERSCGDEECVLARSVLLSGQVQCGTFSPITTKGGLRWRNRHAWSHRLCACMLLLSTYWRLRSLVLANVGPQSEHLALRYLRKWMKCHFLNHFYSNRTYMLFVPHRYFLEQECKWWVFFCLLLSLHTIDLAWNLEEKQMCATKYWTL